MFDHFSKCYSLFKKTLTLIFLKLKSSFDCRRNLEKETCKTLKVIVFVELS